MALETDFTNNNVFLIFLIYFFLFLNVFYSFCLSFNYSFFYNFLFNLQLFFLNFCSRKVFGEIALAAYTSTVSGDNRFKMQMFDL